MQNRLPLNLNARPCASWPKRTCTEMPRAPVKGTRARERLVRARDSIEVVGRSWEREREGMKVMNKKKSLVVGVQAEGAYEARG